MGPRQPAFCVREAGGSRPKCTDEHPFLSNGSTRKALLKGRPWAFHLCQVAKMRRCMLLGSTPTQRQPTELQSMQLGRPRTTGSRSKWVEDIPTQGTRPPSAGRGMCGWPLAGWTSNFRPARRARLAAPHTSMAHLLELPENQAKHGHMWVGCVGYPHCGPRAPTLILTVPALGHHRGGAPHPGRQRVMWTGCVHAILSLWKAWCDGALS